MWKEVKETQPKDRRLVKICLYLILNYTGTIYHSLDEHVFNPTTFIINFIMQILLIWFIFRKVFGRGLVGIFGLPEQQSKFVAWYSGSWFEICILQEEQPLKFIHLSHHLQLLPTTEAVWWCFLPYPLWQLIFFY